MPYNYLTNRKILSSSMHCSVQELQYRTYASRMEHRFSRAIFNSDLIRLYCIIDIIIDIAEHT